MLFEAAQALVIRSRETGFSVPVTEWQWRTVQYIVTGAYLRREKVGAIKAVKESLNFGLREAKHLVEAAAEMNNLPVSWQDWQEDR